MIPPFIPCASCALARGLPRACAPYTHCSLSTLAGVDVLGPLEGFRGEVHQGRLRLLGRPAWLTARALPPDGLCAAVAGRVWTWVPWLERKSAGREWHVRAELRVWNGREWHFSRRKYFLCMPTTCAVSREPTLANANSPMRHAGDHAVPTAPHDSSDPVCFSTIHARYQSSTPRARRSPERLHDGSRGVAHVGVLVLRGERRLQPREDGWGGVSTYSTRNEGG